MLYRMLWHRGLCWSKLESMAAFPGFSLICMEDIYDAGG